MSSGRARSRARPRAIRLCQSFEGSPLARWARAGLAVLEKNHKKTIRSGNDIACGVPLDRCRRAEEPHVHRWDYVFVRRDFETAIAIEVHHASADEAETMIQKKAWAETLLATYCPAVEVALWLWVAAPGGDILFSRQHPVTRRLADAGIAFPMHEVELP